MMHQLERLLEKYRHRVLAERLRDEAVSFFASFVIAERFNTAEAAFLQAFSNLKSLPEDLRKLAHAVSSGMISVYDALSRLSEFYADYSPACSRGFELIKNELFSPARDMEHVFGEVLTALQAEVERDFIDYENSFRFLFTLLGFAPVALLFVMPVSLAIVGVDTTSAFIIAILIFTGVFSLGIVRMSRQKLQLPKAREVVLSIPILPSLYSTWLRIRQQESLHKELRRAEQELMSMPALLQELEITLKRGLPAERLKKKLKGEDRLPMLKIAREAVDKAILHGKAGVGIINSLRFYVSRVIDYSLMVRAKLSGMRAQLRLLSLLTPSLLLFSVLALAYLAEVLQGIGEQGALPFYITPPYLPAIFLALNPGMFLCLNLLGYACSEKEDLPELQHVLYGMCLLLVGEVILLIRF